MSETPRTDANESITCKDGDLCIAPDFARKLERELNAAKTENAAMKKIILQIYYDTETYADGSPDATAHDKLCNEISSQLEPYIYLK